MLDNIFLQGAWKKSINFMATVSTPAHLELLHVKTFLAYIKGVDKEVIKWPSPARLALETATISESKVLLEASLYHTGYF